MSDSHAPSLAESPLFPLYLSLGTFLAYIWATPLRDLFGLETRNGLFTKIMVSDGPSLIPTVMGTPYADYPPLYFWCSWLFSLPTGQVTTVSLVLPSAFGAAVMVAITFMLAKKISVQTALIAALALATCPDYWLKAGRATIDMLLALWVSLAIFFLYLRYHRPAAASGRAAEVAAFFMMLLAFFTKGPVGLVLPVGIWATFLICEKKWRLLLSFAMKSLMLAATCIGIDFLLLWQSGGSELIRKVFEAQLAGRVGDEANEPVYYYLIYLLSGAAPWWIPACFGFFRAGRQDSRSISGRTFLANLFSQEAMRLAACWLLFVLALFSAASTRHSRYLLPLFPALFLLIGRGIELFVEHSSLLRKQGCASVFRYLFFLLMAAWTVMYIAAPLSYRPPIFFWLIWLVCSILIYVMVGKTGQSLRAISLALLCVGSTMAAESMLVEPWISHRESGRDFIRQTEAEIGPTIPVVLYKIHPDGDGLKYALYSSRRSEALSFTDTPAELNSQPLPYVLIAFDKTINELAMPGQSKAMKVLAQGLVHRKKITSWLIGEKKQNIQPEQKLGGAPALDNGY
ncbi:MAG: glycosyltransferase family 39 protein [Proteobacteria bacterium]|nr:glycosyltransferase family 39 protein [Pseudomonadota bacterium]MBU4296002.1 glycosyltransferase family 39 protein [Pseudomonadota bacterium]MCG2747253.1 glycosyltransferase family 39 protein [Desulfobulbaceae bacterium]